MSFYIEKKKFEIQDFFYYLWQDQFGRVIF